MTGAQASPLASLAAKSIYRKLSKRAYDIKSSHEDWQAGRLRSSQKKGLTTLTAE